MTENTARTTMLDKVRKLFAKADSVAGTPEAEVFNAKAYELIARYGVDETEARQRAGEGPAPITSHDFTLTGPYIREQRILLQVIAKALHCAPVYVQSALGNRDIVAGTDMHVDRVTILFSTLMPQMLAGASHVKATPGSGIGVKAARMSWMRGFYMVVGERLAAAETTAATESIAGTALVLVDDAKRAATHLRNEMGGKIKSVAHKARHDGNAYSAGQRAGSRVNLGASQLGRARALTR